MRRAFPIAHNASCDNLPMRWISFDLSIVFGCSAKAKLSTFNPVTLSALMKTCVGKWRALLTFADKGMTSTVGEYLFPMSFCAMITARVPRCSWPSPTRRAKYISPNFISIIFMSLMPAVARSAITRRRGNIAHPILQMYSRCGSSRTGHLHSATTAILPSEWAHSCCPRR